MPIEPKLSLISSPTAAFKIDLAGTELTQRDPKSLEQFVVETHLDKIGRAEIVLGGDSEVAPKDLNIGDAVKVSIGGDARQAFEGTITHLTHVHQHGTDMVRVVAMDPLIKLAASNATTVWGGAPSDSIVDSDLAGEIIGRGCTAGTVDSTTGGRPYVLQRAESNLRFLKRLAARNGYLVYAEEGKVHFKKPQFSDEPIEISAADWITVETTKSDVGIPSTVRVFGWNYVDKVGVTGDFGASDIETIGSGSPPNPQTWAGENHIVDVFVNSDDGAAAMAEGVMSQMARTLVQSTVKVQGNGALYPGVKVKLSGSFTNFNAEGVVVGVRHVWESGDQLNTTIWFVGNTEPS